MAGNTKLGLVLILLILSAFGFVVYKKTEQHKLDEVCLKHDDDAPPPEGEHGDGRTFGHGGKPFGSDDDSRGAHRDGFESKHDQLHAGQRDAPRPEDAHADHHDGLRDSRHDSQMAQGDPDKPNLLEQKDDLSLGEESSRRLPTNNIRAAAPEQTAFGKDEFGHQKEPVPFGADKGRGKDRLDATDALPGDPAHQRPAKSPQTASIDIKKRAPRPADALDNDAPLAADDEATPRKARQHIAKDDLDDTFGGADDSAPEHAAADEPQTARADDPAPAPSSKNRQSDDAFGASVDGFADEAATLHRRPAPVDPQDGDRPQGEESFAGDPDSEQGTRHRESPGAGSGRRKQENFIEGEAPTWGQGPRRDHKHAEGGSLGDAPPPGGRPDLAGQETYVVQANDNFWSISRKKYGTARYFRLLAQLNQETAPDPERMRPGTTIVTPSKEFLETHCSEILAAGADTRQVSAEANSENAADAVSGGFFRDDAGRPMYRVGSADTLEGIARRHLGRITRWIQIFELNRDRLSSPDDLHAGTELVLPADAHRGELVQALHEGR